MMKILLAVLLLVLIYGCTTEPTTIESHAIATHDGNYNVTIADTQEESDMPIVEEQYPSQLTQIAPIRESESGQEDAKDAKKEDERPVLKNLGVNIDAWDRKTNKAGDLMFSKQLIFDDGNIRNDWVLVEFGGAGQRKSDPPGSNIEYWFFVTPETKVSAPVDGTVQTGFFEHTQDWGINFHPEGMDWIVSFEHVVNLSVKDGDRVKAGDIVAEAAPRIGNDVAMVELAVWKGGRSIVKYCPFEFLDDSLRQVYEEKINQLAEDWESFIGKDAYRQEDWVAPGCLLHNITER